MWHSLGKITCVTAGLMYRVTLNETDSTARLACFSIFVQQIPTNTSYLYVFKGAAGSKTTLEDCLAIIPAPSSTAGVVTNLPYVAITVPHGSAPLNAADFYVTSEVSGEFALVSFVRL